MQKWLVTVSCAFVVMAAGQVLVDTAVAQHYPSPGGISTAGPAGPVFQFTDGAGNSMYFVGSSNTWGFSNTQGGTPGSGGTIRFAALSAMSGANDKVTIDGANARLNNSTTGEVRWTDNASASAGTVDILLERNAATVLGLFGNAGSTSGAALHYTEMTAPADPGANNVRTYAKDVAGTTNYCIKFPGGNESCTADPVP